MTFPSLKVAVGQQDRTTIKGRVVARFPAQVTGANGLDVTKAGGAYTIANNWGALVPATNVPDPGRTWLPMWVAPAGDGAAVYQRVTFSAFVSAMLQGQMASLQFVMDGGGTQITTGIKGDIVVPFGCEIIEAGALADQVGGLVVDIWRDSYGNYPPTDADSITAAAPITLSSEIKSRDTVLTGWSKTLTEGQTLRIHLDSCSTIQRATIYLKVRRT